MVTNFKDLAKTPLREKAFLIADAGYKAIEIEETIKNRIILDGDILKIDGNRFDLAEFKRIFLAGIGKGSALASKALAEILGKKLTKGIALDVQKPDLEIRNLKLEILAGAHPLPSEQNVKATRKIIELASGLEEDDLLIVFICGGGSALGTASLDELKDSMVATKALTAAGADIIELNTIRKHLSELKGGGLAKIAYPATIVSIIVSDVLGNDLSFIASAPTVLDHTTKNDAENVLKKYGLNPSNFHLLETPKEQKFFEKSKNILFVSNETAAKAMEIKAKELGFMVQIESLALRGEAKEIFLPLVEKIRSGEAIIATGETTVQLQTQNSKLKIQNIGKGGRNMEAVLGAIAKIQNDVVVISFASDGHDNTEAAGAIGDELTINKAKELNLNPEEFLANHDSFHFFERTGDLIFAEKKNFNVADLMIVLK